MAVHSAGPALPYVIPKLPNSPSKAPLKVCPYCASSWANIQDQPLSKWLTTPPNVSPWANIKHTPQFNHSLAQPLLRAIVPTASPWANTRINRSTTHFTNEFSTPSQHHHYSSIFIMASCNNCHHPSFQHHTGFLSGLSNKEPHHNHCLPLGKNKEPLQCTQPPQ